MEKITRVIAGHEITLTKGERYFAGRPMAQRGRKVYPVSIKAIETGTVSATIPGLSYGQANKLLKAFNNDHRGSLYGRVW